MQFRFISRFGFVLLVTLGCFYFAACGTKKTTEQKISQDFSDETVEQNAENNSIEISEVLQRLKGRWVKEIPDPTRPNPATMRLYASAPNTLTGRFLIGGVFSDVGVAATLKQEGSQFTLILRDDDLRPHTWIPKERVLTGTYDEEKKELTLQSEQGEYVRWQFPEEKYKAVFWGNIYRCVLVPTPLPSASPATANISSVVSRFALPAAVQSPAPAPTATPVPIVAAVNSCGIMASWKEDWSRMSGSQ